MRRHGILATGVLAVTALAATACGSSGSSSPDSTAAGGRALTVGVLNSDTGPYSAGYTGTHQGIDARLKSYAAGGGKCANVKIRTVAGDDQSSPQGALQAAQKLVQQDKVFAILNVTPAFFGAAPYLTTIGKNTPVFGGGVDGAKQWTQSSVKNLFPAPAVTDYHNVFDTFGRYLKSVGATKIAGLSNVSPSAQDSIAGLAIAVKSSGLTMAYTNVNLATGTTDVGAVVLAIKNSGADAVMMATIPTTAFAIQAGLKQAGVTLKSFISLTGYGADLLTSPAAVQAGQGMSFATNYAPSELNSPATQAQSAALKQYAGSTSGLPSFSQAYGWLAADLFLYALENAGCDASQADILKFMSKSDQYDAGGLLPDKQNFPKPASGGKCYFVTTLKGNGFVLASTGKPVCGEPTGENVAGH